MAYAYRLEDTLAIQRMAPEMVVYAKASANQGLAIEPYGKCSSGVKNWTMQTGRT